MDKNITLKRKAKEYLNNIGEGIIFSPYILEKNLRKNLLGTALLLIYCYFHFKAENIIEYFFLLDRSRIEIA